MKTIFGKLLFKMNSLGGSRYLFLSSHLHDIVKTAVAPRRILGEGFDRLLDSITLLSISFLIVIFRIIYFLLFLFL
jgi:hypothetical protein